MVRIVPPRPRALALTLLLPVGLLLPGRGAAQTAGDSATAAVAAFHQALARGDSVTALALLAPDAVILESGELETREEYRSHHLPADIAFARAVPAAAGVPRVVVAGDVAWVTSTSRTEGTFQGRAVDSQNAELIVLSRGPAGWRIRAVHWSGRSRRRG